MPSFAFHRTNWNIVYPHMSSTDTNDINALKKQRTYVVGFTEAGLESRSDLYDLFINGTLFKIYFFIYNLLNLNMHYII